MVSKKLKDYLECINELILETHDVCDFKDIITINHISYNSLDVVPCTLFICKGQHFKNEYLEDAIGKGAVCYVAEKVMTDKIPGIIVNDIRQAINCISGEYYNHIWNEGLECVGITGTKGKSTTSFLIKSVLDYHNQKRSCGKTALVSGIYNYDGKNKQKAVLTTPETIELHKILADSVKNKCNTLIMEVSSQGLKCKRVDDIRYKIGVFLNIGSDHISDSEHKSFREYFETKLELFKYCEVACINSDIEEIYLDEIIQAANQNGCEIVTFGRNELSDFRGKLLEESNKGLKIRIYHMNKQHMLWTNLVGACNITNLLAAFCICSVLEIPTEDILYGLKDVNIPGRMEMYDIPDKNAKIIVDYAHNKMSYEALFETVNKVFPGYKKLFMFGCAADRAFNRRVEAGKIAEKEADKVVITKYDDGKETFDEICKSILECMTSEKDVQVYECREEAIKHCISNAKDGWVIILAGCESDSAIVKKLLGEKTSKNTP